ncbi:hypothetical protein B0F90DRAFT_1668805 [Multifurca ochricompacta]|uniref:Uncharacterized protein n=1 Tax=Multifurca ochricompacta TaxID=376703 RepID=A0AAD4QMP2_9AGAM|nr:hypothetical protein B0F90DRAFT_1668805 [Multifurca ochricompacta]
MTVNDMKRAGYALRPDLCWRFERAPPLASDNAVKLNIGSEGVTSVKYDALGPLVINRDGVRGLIVDTVSHYELANMTPTERERTFRVLVARNQIRLTNQDQEQTSSPGELLGGASQGDGGTDT